MQNINRVKHLVQDAIYLAMIVVLETALQGIPNVQLTTLLIFLYVNNNRVKNSIILITCYVFIDNMQWGYGIYTLSMWFGWMSILLTKLKIFNKIPHYLKIAGFSLIYCWVYIPFSVLLTGVSWEVYLVSDIPYEAIFVTCNTLIVLWLYDRIEMIYKQLREEDYYEI